MPPVMMTTALSNNAWWDGRVRRALAVPRDASVTAGFANLPVQTFGWPCMPVDARAQPRVGCGRVLIGRASCAQSYGVVRRVPIYPGSIDRDIAVSSSPSE